MDLKYIGQKMSFGGGSVAADVGVRPGKEFVSAVHLFSVLAGGQILNLPEL